MESVAACASNIVKAAYFSDRSKTANLRRFAKNVGRKLFRRNLCLEVRRIRQNSNLKSIMQKQSILRSGLLTVEKIAEMFCLSKDTFLKKWNSGEAVICELQLRIHGKSYVADENHVWKILERYKNSLEFAVPRFRDEIQRSDHNRIPRRQEQTETL